MKALVYIYIVLITTLLNAQSKTVFHYPSSENYSSTEGGAIFLTSSNHILMITEHVSGSSVFNATGNTYLSKLDLNGNLIKSIKLNKSQSATISRFTELSTDRFLITSGIDSDGAIIEFDSNLNIIRENYYGDRGNNGFYYDRLVNTIMTNDHNLLSIGTSGSMSSGQASMYVSKTDTFGNILWDKTFGFNGDEDGSDIIELNNKYYAFGYGTGLFGATVPFCVKINSNGNMAWTKVFTGLNGGGTIRNVFPTSNYRMILIYQDSYHNTNNNGTKSDIYISVVDTNFNNLATKRIGYHTYNKLNTSFFTKQGEIIISGLLDYDTSFRSTAFLDESIPFALKFDNLLNLEWSYTYNDNQYVPYQLNGSILSNLIVSDNHIFMSYCADSIITNSNNYRYKVLLNKLPLNGNGGCNSNFNIPVESTSFLLGDFTNSVNILSGGAKDNIGLTSNLANESLSSFSICSSNETNIDKHNLDNYFDVYPNPVEKNSTISFKTNLKIKSLSLFDVNGTKHALDLSNNNIKLPSDLTTGVYFIDLTTDNSRVIKKIIIQ